MSGKIINEEVIIKSNTNENVSAKTKIKPLVSALEEKINNQNISENAATKAVANKTTKGFALPNINYNLLMEEELAKIVKLNKKPTLLLHSCCAPCSSYVLKLLQKFFHITVFFYNTNLFPSEEYLKRLKEQKRLIRILNKECKERMENGEIDESVVFYETPIKIKTSKFVPEEFYKFVKGYEKDLEGENRCYLCYLLRINKTGLEAKRQNFGYFTTTLSVSPFKNSKWINEVGAVVSKRTGANFLHADFKKNDGYKKSIEYSREYGLYRQIYCGCEFSLKAKKNCLV